jgi:hypothetical protein
MADQIPKRKPGRPRKDPTADVTFDVTIPRHHYDYLEFLALKKHRLGISAKVAAEHILIRELDKMFTGDYHAKEIPEA